jgi:hypothetical protein
MKVKKELMWGDQKFENGMSSDGSPGTVWKDPND